MLRQEKRLCSRCVLIVPAHSRVSYALRQMYARLLGVVAHTWSPLMLSVHVSQRLIKYTSRQWRVWPVVLDALCIAGLFYIRDPRPTTCPMCVLTPKQLPILRQLTSNSAPRMTRPADPRHSSAYESRLHLPCRSGDDAFVNSGEGMERKFDVSEAMVRGTSLHPRYVTHSLFH